MQSDSVLAAYSSSVAPRQHRAELLRGLAQYSTWTETSSGLRRVTDCYVNCLRRWFADLKTVPLNGQLSPFLYGLLRDLLSELNAQDIDQVLRIPRLRELSLSNPHLLTAYQLGLLIKILYAYLASAGRIEPEPPGIWDPWGSRFVSTKGQSHNPDLRVDVSSDFPIPVIPDLQDGYLVDPQRAEQAQSVFCSSIAAIREDCPPAAQLVNLNAEVFVLRFGRGVKAQGLSSSSCHEWCGAIFLINADQGADIVARVAESALHECIHTYIYKIEELTTRFSHDGRKVVSPWSGNAIAAANYIHACFVWYGLVHFWRQRIAASNGDRFLRYLDRAEAGFLSRRIFHSRDSYRDFVDPDVLDLLLEMEADICRSKERSAT